MPDLNVIKKYPVSGRNVSGLILEVEETEDILEWPMVGVGVNFKMHNGQKISTPIDKHMALIQKDGSRTALFYFDKLNLLYEPIGFSTPEDAVNTDPFNFPPLIA